MSLLTELVRQHGPEYLERHSVSVLPSHARAVQCLSRCRTAALGAHLNAWSEPSLPLAAATTATPAEQAQLEPAASTRDRR